VIGFLGLSHLGLVSAAAAASKGFEVTGFDEDASLVSSIRDGRLPVVEPGLPELLASTRERLRLTSELADLADCDLLYVAVDVPTAADDSSDPAPVARLLELAVSAARSGVPIVVLSQVEPGFTRAQRTTVEQGGSTLWYQVETLIFGRAVERALEPERFMVGAADPSAPLDPALADHLAAYDCPILMLGYESAELCKIAINAFLVSTLTTTNTLAELCEAIGASWSEIAPALRLDARIGPHAYLTPGLGIGGANLSRDLATIERLAAASGADAGVVGAWRSHADHRRDWPLAVLHDRVLSRVEAPRIAVWGLAYKQDTQSTRNSPGARLARTLARAGVSVAAYDPEAEPVQIDSSTFTRTDDAVGACAGADALVVATPWASFAQVDLENVAGELRGDVVVDPYAVLDAARCAAAGLTQVRLGSPTC
jgi:UDPglucose 6-dehydrogenase